MKLFINNKEGQKKEEVKASKKKRKNSGGHHKGKDDMDVDTSEFLAKELAHIGSPYCNFSNKYKNIMRYQNILK